MITQTCRAILPAEYFKNWFSEGAMRWFNTRLIESATATRPEGFYFVTHDEREPFTSMRGVTTSGAKGYTLRRCTADGIETLGELMRFKTVANALAAVPLVTPVNINGQIDHHTY